MNRVHLLFTNAKTALGRSDFLYTGKVKGPSSYKFTYASDYPTSRAFVRGTAVSPVARPTYYDKRTKKYNTYFNEVSLGRTRANNEPKLLPGSVLSGVLYFESRKPGLVSPLTYATLFDTTEDWETRLNSGGTPQALRFVWSWVALAEKSPGEAERQAQDPPA
jgi:hypothetical protein